VSKKLTAEGTDPDRLPERIGRATLARPDGRLLWCHAASVGESMSLLRLITVLGQAHQDLSFLLTSGTATSAKIIASRLPPRCQHQFAPLDTPLAVSRFLKNWSPTAAVFVESELWPNMVQMTGAAGIPMALVNARISEGSAKNWKRASKTAKYLFEHFRLIHCQDKRTEDHLRDLGLDYARKGQNLKSMANPLPVDAEEKAGLDALIGNRPVWLASSTHPGEDQIMLDAHASVLKTMPDALLILVPRHPERSDSIKSLIEASGMPSSTRAEGATPAQDTQVYLANTLGETGLWYALCPVTCLCGSFVPVGGHNPFEPAQSGSALCHGPQFSNFAEVYEDFANAQASIQVDNTNQLAHTLTMLLTDIDKRKTLATQGKALALKQAEGLEKIAEDLSSALELG
jgi:3-deoxy-D-manno-octulosonic-acid transferase